MNVKLAGSLLLGATICSTAHGVVIYDAGVWPYVPPPPPTQWTGQWGSNAGAVAIGPDVIITTRHQGGGSGTNVKFGATTYKVGAELSSFASNIDLRVMRITNLDNSAVTLAPTDYTTLYSGSALGKVTAMVGWGASIGTSLGGTGYNFNVHSPENAGPQLTGANIIDLSGTVPSGTYSGMPIIASDFDGPSGNGSTPNPRVAYEAHLGLGDSGGGWYILDSGVWKLVGLTHGIEDLTNATFGDQAQAVRLESFVSTINSFVPEPASLGVLALSLGGLLRRRR